MKPKFIIQFWCSFINFKNITEINLNLESINYI